MGCLIVATLTVKKTEALRGTAIIPGDKSISHRGIMLGALAEGDTRITNFLLSADCLGTLSCFRQLGIPIEQSGTIVTIKGQGLNGLQEPDSMLDVGNSGTTIRLLSGILAGQNFTTFITGDASIVTRPMARITEPLSKMGATIIGRNNANFAPLGIKGGHLNPITYHTPVASAQVKSAILLAGLFAEGWTEVIEPAKSRDHTELMLQGFGVPIEVDGLKVRVAGKQPLVGGDLPIPGDISSAAFLLVAATIIPDSKLVLKNVGLNPSRTGIIDVLKAMGGKLDIVNQRSTRGEQVGDIIVESSELHGTTIDGDLIPRLIDEIPVIAVAAAFANGVTEIRDAAELKVKESNRITTVATEFSKLGMNIAELDDGLRIQGGQPLTGAVCDSYGDHRIALSLAIAGLMAEGETVISGSECIAVSYPDFAKELSDLGGIVHE